MKERSLKSVQGAQTVTVPPVIKDVNVVNDTTIVQGPRSNFEIGGVGGGGAPLVTRYWEGGGGGTRHLFLLTLYNSKNIGVAYALPPLLRGPCSLY